MGMKRGAVAALAMLAIMMTSAFAKDKKPPAPTASLNFVVVKDDNGKPVRNAAVVLHPVNDQGQQEKGSLELKTDPDGKATYDGVPYGKLLIQVLAHGFQTFGQDYDVEQPNMQITIRLQRPSGQYSIYEDHPADEKAQDPNKK
jgi:hypothetical protein